MDYKNWILDKKIVGVESFRDTQVKSFTAYEKNDTGLFELTCGAGKTLIQAAILKNEMQDLERRKRWGVFVIASHRLLLNVQLVKEYARFIPEIDQNNDKVMVSYFCGVDKVIDDEGNDIAFGNAHSSIKGIKEDIVKAQKLGKHLIIFTTTASEKYHQENLIKLFSSKTKGIDLYVHDEAHKEMNQEMIQAIQNIAVKSYFFTATPGEYLRETLGFPLVKYTYTQAIEDRVVLPPVLYTVNADGLVSGKKEDRFNAECWAIKDSFEHLKDIENERGNDNPTLLVFLPSIESVGKASQFLVNKNIDADIYSFASYKEVKEKDGNIYRCGSCRFNDCEFKENGQKYTKVDLLSKLRSSNRPKIILNAFMLTEGIDLPSINGVLILATKTDASLYQAVMRGCRVSRGKKDFAIYAPIDFCGNNYLTQVYDFLRRLIETTNACFDFGGHIKDEANGKGIDGDDKDVQQKVHDMQAKALFENELKFNIEKEKENWDYKSSAKEIFCMFINECVGKDKSSIAMIKKKYIFERYDEIKKYNLLKDIATYTF